jgi:membrane-bound ClpP family serine protease
MDKRNLAFGKMNFILLAIGVAVIILGFLLMSGSGTTEEAFNPDIFSTMRVKVAPVICFLGFVSMIYAIVRKPKDEGTTAVEIVKEEQVVAEEDTKTVTKAAKKDVTKVKKASKK